ncbi:MAG: phosphomethylpyrimidine synthase ThiC [Candidatus Aureabacteria bacterium]|nr:phosphomethylpyrimidine synthase ThiC [Candidatus Auribacterota bacterium]
MSLLTDIRNGNIPDFIKNVAETEKVTVGFIKKGLLDGSIIIPRNIKRVDAETVAIGKGLFTKINANIGTSKDKLDVDYEISKAITSVKYGADAVMDLSTWGDLSYIRKRMLEEVKKPVGTVPVYEIAYNKLKEGKNIEDVTTDEFFDVIEKQASEGVDFMTIHSGVCRETMKIFEKNSRIMGIVSRGGALTARWMYKNKKENPYFEHFERLLEILLKYDVTLSLGDGMRPGCIADATDEVQLKELSILGELADRAFEKGVQVMIEGPGHVPLNQIEFNMKIQQVICKNKPFYVLGPLVTDIAPGYDHITSAIGGAIAASNGADFLCYVTPAEHLKLPDIDDVREGVIASKIAAHASDIVKRPEVSMLKDLNMSKHRRKRDWKKQIECAIDPEKAQALHDVGVSEVEDVCTMCSGLCPIKILDEMEVKE